MILLDLRVYFADRFHFFHNPLAMLFQDVYLTAKQKCVCNDSSQVVEQKGERSINE